MVPDNARRQNGSASATTHAGKPPTGYGAPDVRAGGLRRLRPLLSELLGAIDDHRKWINSERARALGTTFVVSGRLLAYAAYIALAWLAFDGFVVIRSGLATGMYAIPADIEGSRVALFNMLAAGLIGPIAMIAIGMGIGWMYNLTTATAHRYLPRFVQPWVHPSILFSVVAAFATFHSPVSTAVANAYLYAQANIEAASHHTATIEKVKIIEIPVPDASSTPEVMDRDTSSERELVRLKSMFHDIRPCPKEAEGAEPNPQSEAARPEPGLASSQDCQAEKTGPQQ